MYLVYVGALCRSSAKSDVGQQIGHAVDYFSNSTEYIKSGRSYVCYQPTAKAGTPEPTNSTTPLMFLPPA